MVSALRPDGPHSTPRSVRNRKEGPTHQTRASTTTPGPSNSSSASRPTTCNGRRLVVRWGASNDYHFALETADSNFFSGNPIGNIFDANTAPPTNFTDGGWHHLAVRSVLETDIFAVPAADWERFSRALPAAALGKNVKIEFRFVSDEDFNFAGWYVDDIEVTVP